jgi:hypothetical protein
MDYQSDIKYTAVGTVQFLLNDSRIYRPTLISLKDLRLRRIKERLRFPVARINFQITR